MFTISETEEETLAEALSGIHPDEIESCCRSEIYERGESYIASGAVGVIHYSDGNHAKASVAGTRRYTVTLELNNGEVIADCTCPYTSEYGDICKHIVAVLLAANDETLMIEPKISPTAPNDKEKQLFRSHLETLSQNELLELIERFASAEFRREVVGRITSGGDAEKKLKELELRFQKAIKSGQRHNSADDFLDEIAGMLGEARGYWVQAPAIMTRMIVGFIKRLDELEDSRQFEDYYDDEYYPDTTKLAAVAGDFVRGLDTQEKFKAINAIISASGETGYGTFDGFPGALDELYTNKDIPALVVIAGQAADAKKLVKHEEYYEFLREAMSDGERDAFLRTTAENSKKLTLEYVRYLQQKSRPKDAAAVLDNFFSAERKNAEYLGVRLELAREIGESADTIAELCEATLNNSPSVETLRIAVKTLPELAPVFEEIVRQRSAGQYFDFLEKAGRLDECVKFLGEDWGNHYGKQNVQTAFYKRHAKQFPHEAEEVLVAVIHENLRQTGDRYYDAIADALKSLIEANDERAGEIYDMLKTTYKRRTNLMDKIDAVFRVKQSSVK